MSIGNTNPNPKDVVILQRDDTNTYYGETHISGSGLLFHINSSGHLDVDTSASFYALYPPVGISVPSASVVSCSWASSSISSSYSDTASYVMNGGGSGLTTGSTYQITSSWAISSSWASQSLSSVSSSWASSSISSSYLSGSHTGSTFGTASWAVSASWSPAGGGITPGGSYNISASWASQSLSASYLNNLNQTVNITGSTYVIGTSTIAANGVSPTLTFADPTVSYPGVILFNDAYWQITGRSSIPQFTKSSLIPSLGMGMVTGAGPQEGFCFGSFGGYSIFEVQNSGITMFKSPQTVTVPTQANMGLLNIVNATTQSCFNIWNNSNTNLFSVNSIGNVILYTSGQIVNRTGTVPSNTNFIGSGAGIGVTTANYSNFFGYNAGYNATNANYSNFFGTSAGQTATHSEHSNFFGSNSGNGAINANRSNFFGPSAGNYATNANYSNFFGSNAGNYATNASSSNFFGNNAGNYAENANYSNFFGSNAGNHATNANNSNFFGYRAGYNDTVNNSGGHSSILIGDYTSTGGNTDSIAIGKGTQSPSTNSLNIGNVIYATGIYSGSTSTSASVVGGKVGIGIYSPISTLHVCGSFAANIKVVTGNYLLTTSDYTVVMSGSTLTASLPDATKITGIMYNIKNVFSSNAMVTGSQKIDAGSNYILGQWNTLQIQSSGTQWLILGTL